MPSKIYRTSISIPQELKAQMAAVSVPVNWSDVAARAFRAKLEEIQLRSKRSMTRQDIVKCPKGLQEDENMAEYDEGKVAGREWASRSASPKELRRIAKYIEMYEVQWDNKVLWWDTQDRLRNATVEFVVAARGSGEQNDDPADFWTDALGGDAHRIEDRDFFHGFGHGVLEVWKEVKDEL